MRDGRPQARQRLDSVDAWAREHGLDDETEPPHRFEPTRVDRSPPLGLDLRSGEIGTIVWASGYQPDWSWLDVPVLDRKGRIRHNGGVAAAPGLCVTGLPFLRRRKSSLIDGAGDDARELTAHLEAYLARTASRTNRVSETQAFEESRRVSRIATFGAATCHRRGTGG